MKLVLNVLAMLIAFVGLIAMINFFVGWVSVGGEALTLQRIFGWVFAPLSLCMGIPWSESQLVGTLLGEKIVLTEFIAYMHLGDILPPMDCPNDLELLHRMHCADLRILPASGFRLAGLAALRQIESVNWSALVFAQWSREHSQRV